MSTTIEDENKVLGIITNAIGIAKTFHPFNYPNNESFLLDPPILKLVNICTLVDNNYNKLNDLFRLINNSSKLGRSILVKVDNSLFKSINSLSAVLSDAKTNKEFKLISFNLVFNFQNENKYLFNTSFSKYGDLGVFLEILTASSDKNYSLFEQLYYISK